MQAEEGQDQCSSQTENKQARVTMMQPSERENAQDPTAQKADSPTDNTHPSSDKTMVWTHDKLQVVFNGTVAITAIVGIVVLGYQSCELRQTNVISSAANDTARLAQRAFVNLAPADPPITGREVDPATGKTIGIHFSVSYSNSGSTPARDVHNLVAVTVRTDELPADFEFSGTDPSVTAITYALGPNAVGHIATAIQMRSLLGLGKDRRIYIWGWATYRDVFANSPVRLTEFCIEMVRAAGFFEGSPDKAVTDLTDPRTNIRVLIKQCGRHSCYDEDCQDYKARTKGQPPNQP